MAEMSFENKIKRLKKIQRWTSNWSDDKVVGEAIKAMEKIQEIEGIVQIHQAESECTWEDCVSCLSDIISVLERNGVADGKYDGNGMDSN